MHPYKYTFSFRITHPHEDLGEIFRKLGEIPGFKPRRIWRAEDSRQTPKGQKLEGYYTESYCYFDFFDETQNSVQRGLSEAIENIVSKLELHATPLHDFVARGGEITFRIGWFIDANAEDSFEVNLIEKLANLHIALEFSLYPADDQNELWLKKYKRVEEAVRKIIHRYDLRGILGNKELSPNEDKDAYSGVIEGIMPYVRYESDEEKFAIKLKTLFEFYKYPAGSKELPINNEVYRDLTRELLTQVKWPV